jgi:putative intracellular protease/amidase
MNKKLTSSTIVKGIISLVTFIVLIITMLPKVLRWLGLHPDYDSKPYDLEGKKALIITTSQDILGEKGKATGVYSSEMTVPYYEFVDNGIKVDLASIKGGKIPVEPSSVRWPLATEADKRSLKDKRFKEKLNNSTKIDAVNVNDYDLIFMAGGWGASYDLGQSKVLGEKISKAYEENKILGSVCHGALGFLQAVDEDGNSLVRGKKMTAVTDKQIKELGITKTPLHPETELRKAGVKFESETALLDTLANHVVRDGNIITGQNQNSGKEVANKMMKLLLRKE